MKRGASVRSLRTAFILMNTKKPPFNDVRVRKALNYGVNVQSIIDNLLGGFAERVPTVMGPLVAGYNPRLRPYAYDAETAKKLLAEAGHPNGFTANFYAFRGRLLKDRELAEATGARLAPPTNLRELAWILQKAEAVIGGDTGPLHLADALGTKVVGLYGPTDPRRNGPYHQPQHVIDRFRTTKSMESISVEEVMNTLERVLAE